MLSRTAAVRRLWLAGISLSLRGTEDALRGIGTVITQLMRAMRWWGAIRSAFIFDIRRGRHGRQTSAVCILQYTCKPIRSLNCIHRRCSGRALALNTSTFIRGLCEILLSFIKFTDIHIAVIIRTTIFYACITLITNKGDPCINTCSVLYRDWALNFITVKYSLH